MLSTKGEVVPDNWRYTTDNKVMLGGLEKGTDYELLVAGVDDTAGPSMFPGKASFKTRNLQITVIFINAT